MRLYVKGGERRKSQAIGAGTRAGGASLLRINEPTGTQENPRGTREKIIILRLNCRGTVEGAQPAGAASRSRGTPRELRERKQKLSNCRGYTPPYSTHNQSGGDWNGVIIFTRDQNLKLSRGKSEKIEKSFLRLKKTNFHEKKPQKGLKAVKIKPPRYPD